jgi:cyclopropane-fatty-acyl-phospholipid synthase
MTGTHAACTPLEAMPWLDRVLFSTFEAFASTTLRYGCLELVLPSGDRHEYGSTADTLPAVPDAPAWMEMPAKRCTVTVHNTDMFFKIITRHDTGLGEAFMARDFTVDDLGAFLAIMTANARNIEASRGLLGALNWAGDKALYLAHLTRANSVEGSKKNISEHYDVGNDMYKLFLDDTLTYSSGIYTEDASLQQAQLTKLDALIAGARVTADSHVLEVGCGWGSCAIRAAQMTGCRWTGVRRTSWVASAHAYALRTTGLAAPRRHDIFRGASP